MLTNVWPYSWSSDNFPGIRLCIAWRKVRRHIDRLEYPVSAGNKAARVHARLVLAMEGQEEPSRRPAEPQECNPDLGNSQWHHMGCMIAAC